MAFDLIRQAGIGFYLRHKSSLFNPGDLWTRPGDLRHHSIDIELTRQKSTLEKMVRLGTYAAASAVGAVAVIYHAFHSRGQFYPAIVYLSTSNINRVLLFNMWLVMMCFLWQLVKTLFLGSLREAEVERLNEQSWREVMEILFAITIFRDEFSITFLAMVTVLLLIKALHWLAQKRVEYIETTPSVSRLSHFRIISFMAFLLALDCVFLYNSLSYLLRTKRPSVELFFSFEYMILATTTISTFLKYVFYLGDVLMEGQWESKAVFTFYLELVKDLLHLSLYLFFFLVIFINYGLPLHLIRELYETFRNFKSRVADFIRYRKITSNMNDRFPDATAEELGQSDATCIICREEMVAAKKLPCGHLFHVHCLRSWLERQQTCPTCRSPVIAPETGAERGVQPEQQHAGTEGRQPGLQANVGLLNAPGQGQEANSSMTQHQARVQAALTAAAQYGNSFVYPAAQPGTVNFFPGYVFVPQPCVVQGVDAARNVGTFREGPGRGANSDGLVRNLPMDEQMHFGMQRWLQFQSQILAAQRTSAVMGNNLLSPQVPLYHTSQSNINHFNGKPAAMSAAQDANSQGPSSSSQSTVPAMNNGSELLNIQQMLLRQRIQALQHELESALQLQSSLSSIPQGNTDVSTSRTEAIVEEKNLPSGDASGHVGDRGKGPITSEFNQESLSSSSPIELSSKDASDFVEETKQPTSSHSEIEEIQS